MVGRGRLHHFMAAKLLGSVTCFHRHVVTKCNSNCSTILFCKNDLTQESLLTVTNIHTQMLHLHTVELWKSRYSRNWLKITVLLSERPPTSVFQTVLGHNEGDGDLKGRRTLSLPIRTSCYGNVEPDSRTRVQAAPR